MVSAESKRSRVPPGGNELESKEISDARFETMELLIDRREVLDWAVHSVAGTPHEVIAAAELYEQYLDGSYTPPSAPDA